MTEQTQEKLSQLQMYEQSVQNLVLQKQQFQAQISEIESALKELKTSTRSYKIIGNIMVAAEKDELIKDLETKKSTVNLRLTTLEKQEKTIKEKASNLQSEVMKQMESKG